MQVPEKFNLAFDHWVKVKDQNGDSHLLSPAEIFEDPDNYVSLNGDMKTQDLTTLRFLEAILITVYSRVDENGKPYSWIKLDSHMRQTGFDENAVDQDCLLNAVDGLLTKKSFTEALKYLELNRDSFDFKGGKTDYDQISLDKYNSIVTDKFRLDKKSDPLNKPSDGKWPQTVPLKTLNRKINESNNKDILFTMLDNDSKSDMTWDQFIRWMICYVNYCGISDKVDTKAKAAVKKKFCNPKNGDKIPMSRGWMYLLNPVYADQSNLFETLLYNMTLMTTPQTPLWEQDINDYADKQIMTAPLQTDKHTYYAGRQPENTAELYTNLGRLIYINYDKEYPRVYPIKLPRFEPKVKDIEPMTLWNVKYDDDGQITGYDGPKTRYVNNIHASMWQKFGLYVSSLDAGQYAPGIINWLNKLKNTGVISKDTLIDLQTAGFVSKEPVDQAHKPLFEMRDDMTVKAGVLFDNDPNESMRWQKIIDDAVKTAQEAVIAYRYFLKDVGVGRDMDTKNWYSWPFLTQAETHFWDDLNKPFKSWLSHLNSSSDKDQQLSLWRSTLKDLALKELHDFQLTSRDMNETVFVGSRKYKSKIQKLTNNLKEGN